MWGSCRTSTLLARLGVEGGLERLHADAAIGTRTGPGFAYDEIVPAIERILTAYVDLRESDEETFLQAYRRVGMEPFKAALYPEKEKERAHAA
jgi:sulfite reductase (NADPH) hemoprotein beta-component